MSDNIEADTLKDAPMDKTEFCARFKSRMLHLGADYHDDPKITRYAEETALLYYDDHRKDNTLTPEECAETDVSYWDQH